jgi:putative ABC transport system permease protein
MTHGALIVGASALSFTLGMEASLHHVGAALFRDHASPVRVEIPNGLVGALKPGQQARPAPLSPADVEAAIAAQPATQRFVAIGEADVTVANLANPVPFFATRGDATWLGYVVMEGRWYAAPGEVVVPENFLRQTGLHVGDAFTASVGLRSLDLRIVGSIFDNARCRCDGPRNVVIRGDWATLAAADPDLVPSSWEVAVKGDLMRPAALASAIRQATNGYADAYPAGSADTDDGFLLFEGVIAALGLILVVVALGGVANTVLLESRERLRETAILRVVGMTPRQVVVMVVASIAPLGVVAALVGMPVGGALMRAVIANMGELAIASSVPASMTDTLSATDLLAILAGGVLIALLGAWLPARRTASVPIAPLLAAE